MKEFKFISSKENSLVKQIIGLQTSAKSRRENGLFVLEGLRICLDAMENSVHFDKLIISEAVKEKLSSEIETLSQNADECYVFSENLFKKISDTNTPQGIIAVAKIPDKKDFKIDRQGRYVALENLSDPSNLGAVSRTAEALGVSGIILSDDSCDPYSPKVLRASMGTLLRMPLIILDDFSSEISNLGLRVYSCVVDSSAKKITDIDFSSGCVVVIGNEANGITEQTKAVSDECITIPMLGKAESLNAATAAAIAMWEMLK